MSAPPIVEMTGISISFPGVKALDGVDFRLFPGEVHALMGENGAGKSTLIKALTGVYTIDEGQVRIDGTPRLLSGTADAQAAGISTVYQEVNLCTNITIGENVMLGHETRGPLGINWRETHRRASEVLEKVGLGELNPRLPLSTLSIALQQLVAISRATVTDSKVLILDEPTSSLDANEVEDLFTVIMRDLRERGRGDPVRLPLPRPDLRDQRPDDRAAQRSPSRASSPTADIDQRHAHRHDGRQGDGGARLARDDISAPAARWTAAAPLSYSAEGLGRKGTPRGHGRHPSPRARCIGIAGLLGSGRTELARLVYRGRQAGVRHRAASSRSRLRSAFPRAAALDRPHRLRRARTGATRASSAISACART
jgi:monosaccharide-transporting ATPase